MVKVAKPKTSADTKSTRAHSKKVKQASDDEMPKTATKKSTKSEGRGGKKKKDPNAPKRGLSAYMFFANEQRDTVREENPGISFGMFSDRVLFNLC